MLFKWEIESSGADSKRSNWTLSPYGIFFIIFLETIYVVILMKKSIWEITNALMNSCNEYCEEIAQLRCEQARNIDLIRIEVQAIIDSCSK